MKVKIGDKIYDSGVEPVMVILNDEDKKHIVNMAPELTKYAAAPKSFFESVELFRAWMKTND